MAAWRETTFKSRQTRLRAPYASSLRHRRDERHGPLSVAHTEPDNLRTLTAMIDTPTQRAESAIWLYDRTANVTFCG
jgi:hypothetical protein